MNYRKETKNIFIGLMVVIFGLLLSISYAQDDGCRFGYCPGPSDESPFKATASTIPATPNTDNIRPTRYVVQSGDSLGKIASKFSLTVAELTKANGIISYNNFFVGKVLNIPSK